MLLSKYVLSMLNTQGNNPNGNETMYFFGDNYVDGWEKLLDLHEAPPFARGNIIAEGDNAAGSLAAEAADDSSSFRL